MNETKITVFVLEQYIEWEGSDLLGIFSTREKAEQAKEEEIKNHNDWFSDVYFEITEIEVQ